MAFVISGTQILVSGNETGLSFRTWALTNTAAAKALTANTVEALYQLKIQNGAVFDTSNAVLVINHRVEGQAQATTDSGIWRCKGSVVVVQGSAAMFAEEWAIQDWDGVHVYIQKTGGYQSFIQSNPRTSSATSVKNTKFIVKSGDVDSHLQASGGAGTIQNVVFRNEGVNAGIMGMRDTDTSDLELYRLEPFGWWLAPTSMHKNWTMYNPSANEININYRRGNGGGVFYNATNSFNGQKMTAVRYVSLGAEASHDARSVLVGAYKPTIIGSDGLPVSGVEVAIVRTSDGVTEAAGATGADGRIAIVLGSSNPREQSYNNTFTSGGNSYTKVIRDAGVKYIKQSITPATTGGNVVSVDQGTFRITQRKPGYQEIVAVQSFLTDYEGSKVMFADAAYTSDQSGLTGISASNTTKTITVTSSMTYDQAHDWFRWWEAQSSQVSAFPNSPLSTSTTNATFASGWTLIVGDGATLSPGTKITFLTVPTVTLTGTGKITGLYADSTGPNTVLEIRNIKPGAAYIVVDNATKTTILFGVNGEATAQTYTVQFPPGSAGTEVYVARKSHADFIGFEIITLEPGLIWTTFVDIPDEGVVETNKATVLAYTTLETNRKIYEYVSAYQTTEEGIKLGKLLTRAGPLLNWSAPYSAKLKKDAPTVWAKSGNLFTFKATSLTSDAFTTHVFVPPATMTADTNEVLSTDIEDANGDSSLTIAGGDNLGYKLWKVPSSLAVDGDETTGTLLTTANRGDRYRFIGVTGFDIIGVDNSSGVRRRTSMAKGIYKQTFYVGEQVQLDSEAKALLVNNEKLAVLQVQTNDLQDKINALQTLVDSQTEAIEEIGTPLQAADYTTPPTAAAIAVQVEAAIINEDDGKQVIKAIADKIKAEEVTATAIAQSVRTELTAELARIDVAVSTRSTLSQANVTTALTAYDAATNAKTRTAILEELSFNMDLASAAESSGQASQKADTILAALGTPMQAGTVINANIVKVNNVAVDGTGVEGDEWGPVGSAP